MDWINLAYIAAAIFFIYGIKMLGSSATARQGNMVSAIGMLIAVAATLLNQGILTYTWIIIGLVIGSAIGAVAARRVEMTGMPELVALFNGFGGLASLLVGWAEFHRFKNVWQLAPGLEGPHFIHTVVFLTLLIGGVTFTGSVLAYLKLAGKISGQAIIFNKQNFANGGVLLALLGFGLWLILIPPGTGATVILLAIILLAFALGVLAVIPIGGGDMPVVIAFLNSCSGLAAAAAGFVIFNNVLIVAGCLVGASGLILTVIMCKSMNRTLGNVFFSGFGSGEQSVGADIDGEMKAISVEDAYYVLEAARSVVFVPGYGMAVAQAQHVVKELGEALEHNGAEVRYAIHPVAGRMPGHMNVLLAEADVPYEQLCEMDSVNPTLPMTDVVIVIGANDVVNPAAIDDPSSPIYGMPIINVHEARTVFALKRGQGAGFSGLVNTLFFRPNCRMIYGDAKATVGQLAAQFEGK